MLDLCAIAVPEKINDTDLPFGITIFSLSEAEDLLLGAADKFLESETITLAVCGLHKKGFPLEYQLTQLGAFYIESTKTAEKYKLYQFNSTPKKPGMYYDHQNGKSIEVDLYEIPVSAMGYFMGEIRKPLGIGHVELADGRVVKGFLCEEYSTKEAEDITEKGTFEFV